jgi:hypothetical protein
MWISRQGNTMQQVFVFVDKTLRLLMFFAIAFHYDGLNFAQICLIRNLHEIIPRIGFAATGIR